MSSKRWEAIAPLYRLLRSNPLSQYLLKNESRALEILGKSFLKDERFIVGDIGTGRGHSLNLMPENAKLKIALDQSAAMVRFSRRNFINIKYLRGDALHLPFRENTFDLLICIGLSEYIADLDSLLAQLYYTLKPGRFLIMTSSPKNIISNARNLLGSKIHPRDAGHLESTFKHCGFEVMNQQATLSQCQFLVRKVPVP